MKYCLYCGRIYAESYINYEDETCGNCGFKLIEDIDMIEDQFLKLSESDKDAYELKIYNICKQSNLFDENKYNKMHSDLEDWYYTFRFDKYEQLSGEKAYTKENELYHDMESQKRVSEAMAKYYGTINKSSNIPKCPICQSTNIKKITFTQRAVKTAFFGVIGAVDDAGKTYQCENCGSKF